MINQSRFASLINVLPDATGVDTLYVAVRGTFTLAAKPVLAARATAPTGEDVYWGKPGASSLKYASEVHVGKRGTDVVLVGSAHAPRGRPVPEMLASVSIAGRLKVVRVLGDRTWRGARGGLTHPVPFTTMPLVYERAFGGSEEDGRGGVLAEERNPVGIGFRSRRSASEAAAQKLPNLEDPKTPISALDDRPAPAGFGFVAPSWLPRRLHAGTYDQAWQKSRAPFLPADFDRRFDNAACPDLQFDRFLLGGEPLTLTGVSRGGDIGLSLPVVRPRVEVDIAGRKELPPLQLETVLIEPDAEQLHLSWRAALGCDKSMLKIRSITVQGG